MSRADGAARLLDAAAALGASRGVGALSIQAIADAAGVSKALVLYHLIDKPQLLQALHGHVGAASARRIAAAVVAVDATDPLGAWRALVRDESRRGELALFAALSHDSALQELDPPGRTRVAAVARAREEAATALVEAIFSALDLRTRVDPRLVGRTLLRHLDGVGTARTAAELSEGSTPLAAEAMLDAELDTFALALLGLGA